MAQEFLDLDDRGAAFEEAGGVGMSQCVGFEGTRNLRFFAEGFEAGLQCSGADLAAARGGEDIAARSTIDPTDEGGHPARRDWDEAVLFALPLEDEGCHLAQ